LVSSWSRLWLWIDGPKWRRNGSRERPKVLRGNRMSDTSTGIGRVVVNRAMSLDGFIAGPGDAMGWVFVFVAEDCFRESAAAGGKNLEILGADVAGQCLRRGLVDEILVYVLPVLLGDGIRFSSSGLGRIDLEVVSSTRSGAVTILRFRVRKQSSV